MDQHAKMTFHIGELYSNWGEQVCLYFSAPFTVDADGHLTPEQPEQPTPEKKAELLRDAQAHARLEEFDAAMVKVAGPDAELTLVPKTS